MVRTQLENLIKFTFLFVKSELRFYDPSYIYEKWESVLSVHDDDLKLYTGDRTVLSEYEHVWGIITDDKVYTKVNIVYQLKQLGFSNSFSLPNIIELFEKYIDISEVSVNKSRHTHPLLIDAISKWMLVDINKNEFKSYLRDFSIDSLLID